MIGHSNEGWRTHENKEKKKDNEHQKAFKQTAHNRVDEDDQARRKDTAAITSVEVLDALKSAPASNHIRFSEDAFDTPAAEVLAAPVIAVLEPIAAAKSPPNSLQIPAPAIELSLPITTPVIATVSKQTLPLPAPVPASVRPLPAPVPALNSVHAAAEGCNVPAIVDTEQPAAVLAHEAAISSSPQSPQPTEEPFLRVGRHGKQIKVGITDTKASHKLRSSNRKQRKWGGNGPPSTVR